MTRPHPIAIPADRYQPDPPATEVTGPQADRCGQTRSPVIRTLRKRADFLAAARAARQGTGGMMVQARDRGDGDPVARVGFTCSKKVGNAVARNRAKRRLREAARLVLPDCARAGWDYVLIGRHETTAARAFPNLQQDLRRALEKLHK